MELDVLKQKTHSKEGKDALKQEKDVLKQERTLDDNVIFLLL